MPNALRYAMLRLRAELGPDVNVWLIGSGIAVILLVVATAATGIPARRAVHVDPATTLRTD